MPKPELESMHLIRRILDNATQARDANELKHQMFGAVARDLYRLAGKPYGDTQEGFDRWVRESKQRDA